MTPRSFPWQASTNACRSWGVPQRWSGEEARHLVAPGPLEGVLHDGQKLQVGEAGFCGVLGKLGRVFGVGEASLPSEGRRRQLPR